MRPLRPIVSFMPVGLRRRHVSGCSVRCLSLRRENVARRRKSYRSLAPSALWLSVPENLKYNPVVRGCAEKEVRFDRAFVVYAHDVRVAHVEGYLELHGSSRHVFCTIWSEHSRTLEAGMRIENMKNRVSLQPDKADSNFVVEDNLIWGQGHPESKRACGEGCACIAGRAERFQHSLHLASSPS